MAGQAIAGVVPGRIPGSFESLRQGFDHVPVLADIADEDVWHSGSVSLGRVLPEES
jgi:hypothetical protein